MGERGDGNPGVGDGQGRGRRGPAKDPAKHAAIFAAARRLFARGGYEAVSMDAVAAAAGVTKRTLYNHFGSKERLFAATVADQGDQIRPVHPSELKGAEDVGRTLIAIGVPLLEMLSSPKAHEFGRMMIGQIDRHSELIQRFYAAGPATTHRDLSALLLAAHKKGRLSVPDPDLAADQLISMWLGQHHFRQQLGLAPGRSRAEIETHVHSCVAMFLRAYARRRKR